MGTWARIVPIFVLFGVVATASETSLAERLLAAPDLAAAEQILAAAPSGEIQHSVFEACRKSAEDNLEKRRALEVSLQQFHISLAVAERLNSPADIGAAWLGIGIVNSRLRRANMALASYEKGYPASVQSGSKPLLAHFLRARAVSLSLVGRFDESLADGDRSLALYRELNDRRGQAMMLSNLCSSHRILGDLRRAAAECEESHSLARTVPNALGIGLANLGPVAAQQGNYTAARGYLEESIRLYDQIRDVDRLTNALLNISPVYRRLGEEDKALAVLARALALTEKTRDTSSRAMALFNRAAIYTYQRRFEEAMIDLQAGLKLQENYEAPYESAFGFAALSQLETRMGRLDEACAHADQSLAIARQYQSPHMAAAAYAAQGTCEIKRDNLPQARRSLEESVRQTEAIRDQAGGGEQDGQLLLADRIEPYHNLLAVLVEQRDHPAALNAAERMRARQLLDTVRRGKTQPIASMTAEERQEEKGLSESLARLSRRMSESSGDAKTAVRKEWEKARNDLDAFRGHLYARHPQLAASRGEAAPIQLAEAAELLPDSRTALVEFAALSNNLCIFVIVRGDSGKPVLTMHRVPWDREAVAKAIGRFREQLGAHDLGYRRAASELYQKLLAPAVELRGKDRLVVVPDGPLWNLPFQALIGPDGAHVVERKTVFYAPSLTFLRESRRGTLPDVRGQLLALGNPSTAKLPNAAREVSSLARLYGPAGAVALTGGDATKDAWLRDAPEYRVLHIATHGVLNAANPMYSWLSLAPAGQDPAGGTLEAREILGMNLKADIAVLSACDTARGEFLPGEGLVGMSWAFLAAGTRTAVVSQWGVDSAGTTELMLNFHRNLKASLQERLARSRAGSLQRAVLQLMKTPQYRHPYYWAGFVMIGNGY